MRKGDFTNGDFKKNEKPTNGSSCKYYSHDLEGIYIIGSVERSDKMKRRNAVKALTVIFAVCAALAVAVFIKCRSAEKPEV